MSPDYSNDPEALRELLAILLGFLETVMHERDAAIQVAQLVPNWKDRLQEALNDPLRQTQTHELVSATRQLFSGHPVSDSEIAAISAKLNKKPD